MIVIDSIQLYTRRNGFCAGGIGQVRQCAGELMSLQKKQTRLSF